jgi:hypothetical protein
MQFRYILHCCSSICYKVCGLKSFIYGILRIDSEFKSDVLHSELMLIRTLFLCTGVTCVFIV